MFVGRSANTINLVSSLERVSRARSLEMLFPLFIQRIESLERTQIHAHSDTDTHTDRQTH